MSTYSRRPASRGQIGDRFVWKIVVKIAIGMSLVVAVVAFAAHNQFLTLAAVSCAGAGFVADILFVSRLPFPIRIGICVAGCVLINHWVDQPHSAYQLMADFTRFLASHHLGTCTAKAPGC